MDLPMSPADGGLWLIPIVLFAYALVQVIYIPFSTSPPRIKRIAEKVAGGAFVLSIVSAIAVGILDLVT